MLNLTTVKVRPITFAEITALAHRDAGPVPVYIAEESRRHGLTFTPATLTPQPRRGKAHVGEDVPHQVLYATVPDSRPNATSRWREDKDSPVGHVVSCEIKTMYGTQRGAHLFTTPEAEQTAAEVRGWTDPTAGRSKIYVADAKAGREERLTPTFGAQVSTGFVVEGVDAEEARERAERALRAEFGDAMRPHAKVLSRPVPDHRVNVFSVPDRKPLALNVLGAEVSYYMKASNSVHVEEVDPAAPPIAVG